MLSNSGLDYIYFYNVFMLIKNYFYSSLQKSVHTKELEANGIVNPHLAILDVQKAYPLDLPPSYDDVTKIKVNLVPVHETKAISVNEESNAAALPEKSALADESQA